jgi:peptidoglycan/LPS O-acetylase OafA/YrhL
MQLIAQNRISPALSIWLDAIRGLAAVEVFMGHLRPVCFETDPGLPGLSGMLIKAFYFITSLSHQAVMIFFVLSGFLVGGNVFAELRETGGVRLWPYIAARVARIHSVLIPALLLGGALDAAGAYGLQASDIYEHGFFHRVLWWPLSQGLTWQVFLGNLACVQTVFTPVFGTNGPLWSLTNEFWYYFLFPALLLALWRGARGWRRVAAFATAVAVLWMLGPGRDFYFLIWLAGLAARFLLPVRWSLPTWCAGLVFCTVSFCCKSASLQSGAVRLGLLDSVMAGAFVIFLWSLAKRPMPMPGWLTPGVRGLAASSFTLYACHFPMVIFMGAVLNHFGLWSVPGSILHLRSWLVFVGGFIVIGAAIWGLSILTERKHLLLKQWLAAPRPKTYAQRVLPPIGPG